MTNEKRTPFRERRAVIEKNLVEKQHHKIVSIKKKKRRAEWKEVETRTESIMARDQTSIAMIS